MYQIGFVIVVTIAFDTIVDRDHFVLDFLVIVVIFLGTTHHSGSLFFPSAAAVGTPRHILVDGTGGGVPPCGFAWLDAEKILAVPLFGCG